MKNVSAVLIAMFFVVLSAGLFAAEKDAAGCKDNPLIPRIKDYYIVGCNSSPATFDFDGANGASVHVEGKSTALLYRPQPELKAKPTEAQLRSEFENAVKKQGGAQVGTTPGQKWSVYKIVKDGKQYWIVLMIDSGEYFTGSYAYRIVEK